MVHFTVTFEVPNWGDESKGYHTVNIPRKKYRRDFIPPHSVSFIIECNNTSPDLDEYIFVFELNEVLDKSAENFKDRLFDLINIMQENIHTCGINKSNMSFNEYISTLFVKWEILPQADIETILSKITRNIGNDISQNVLTNLRERVIFFNSLNPSNYIVGTSGLVRYYGIKLADDLVLFENLNYGNALYVMYDDWEYLSQKSRVDLLTGIYGNNFDRIIHKNGWNIKVTEIINQRLNNKQDI